MRICARGHADKRNTRKRFFSRRGRSATHVIPWPIALPGAALGAAGIAAWGAVHPTSQLFGATLHQTPRRSAIALTFDDGPNPAATPQLLALLERHGVRATFFLIGRYARVSGTRARYRRARPRHRQSHRNASQPGFPFCPGIAEELQRCQASIAAALAPGTAAAPAWMRPPFGFRGPQLAPAARRAGLRVAMWSRHFYDWKPQPPERLIRRLTRVVNDASIAAESGPRNSGGPILLLHDGDFRQPAADRRHVIAALEYWLPRWRDAGLEFVTIEQAAGGL